MKSAISFALAVLCAGGVAFAADVTPDVQKTLTDAYGLTCAAVLDPSDKNFDAATAVLSPDYVVVDFKGASHKRDEILAMEKQQLKTFKASSCDNKFNSVTQTDASTIVVVNTSNIAGEIQAPDGKHDFTALNKAQDTWKLVGGKWMQTQSKAMRALIKVDGNVVQDQGD
ncbi:MAG TPA: hypothetical protein VFL13_12370 [Candidatus Baltobacteraceae bacterium]|nr:hypothetical protein [Candidatus Baltobacteraceae bacterium]